MIASRLQAWRWRIFASQSTTTKEIPIHSFREINPQQPKRYPSTHSFRERERDQSTTTKVIPIHSFIQREREINPQQSKRYPFIHSFREINPQQSKRYPFIHSEINSLQSSSYGFVAQEQQEQQHCAILPPCAGERARVRPLLFSEEQSSLAGWLVAEKLLVSQAASAVREAPKEQQMQQKQEPEEKGGLPKAATTLRATLTAACSLSGAVSSPPQLAPSFLCLSVEPSPALPPSLLLWRLCGGARLLHLNAVPLS